MAASRATSAHDARALRSASHPAPTTRRLDETMSAGFGPGPLSVEDLEREPAAPEEELAPRPAPPEGVQTTPLVAPVPTSAPLLVAALRRRK